MCVRKCWVTGICLVISLLGRQEAKSEILLVDSFNTPIVTSSVLDTGRWYQIESQGTYIWSAGAQAPADTEWFRDPSDLLWKEFSPTSPYDDGLDLYIDGMAVDWMGTANGQTFAAHTYSPSHVYRHLVLGEGKALAFQIADYLPSHGSNNSGSLTVQIEAVVPEPSSLIVWFLIGLSFAGIVGWQRRRAA